MFGILNNLFYFIVTNIFNKLKHQECKKISENRREHCNCISLYFILYMLRKAHSWHREGVLSSTSHHHRALCTGIAVNDSSDEFPQHKSQGIRWEENLFHCLPQYVAFKEFSVKLKLNIH